MNLGVNKRQKYFESVNVKPKGWFGRGREGGAFSADFLQEFQDNNNHSHIKTQGSWTLLIPSPLQLTTDGKITWLWPTCLQSQCGAWLNTQKNCPNGQLVARHRPRVEYSHLCFLFPAKADKPWEAKVMEQVFGPCTHTEVLDREPSFQV